jgi:hypothetical protein
MPLSLISGRISAQRRSKLCARRACHLAVIFAVAAACGRPHSSSAADHASQETAVAVADTPSASPGLLARFANAVGLRRESVDPSSYEGHDEHDIPHYATQDFSRDDADILRRAYGIEDPHRLYVSDSTAEGLLKYDTQIKRCRTCYVNSYRIGFVSVRRPGESWDQTERRVRATPAREFAGHAHPASSSVADMDVEVRPLAEAMLSDARAAGFHVRVVATYRSPEREAALMAEGGGRTHTLTSPHTYGRALDVVVDDGSLSRASTRQDWIAFRRWVTTHKLANGESFRILGTVGQTWDWPHLELATERLGFRTTDDAVARGRACLSPGATVTCDFVPNLPERLLH